MLRVRIMNEEKEESKEGFIISFSILNKIEKKPKKWCRYHHFGQHDTKDCQLAWAQRPTCQGPMEWLMEFEFEERWKPSYWTWADWANSIYERLCEAQEKGRDPFVSCSFYLVSKIKHKPSPSHCLRLTIGLLGVTSRKPSQEDGNFTTRKL